MRYAAEVVQHKKLEKKRKYQAEWLRRKYWTNEEFREKTKERRKKWSKENRARVNEWRRERKAQRITSPADAVHDVKETV